MEGGNKKLRSASKEATHPTTRILHHLLPPPRILPVRLWNGTTPASLPQVAHTLEMSCQIVIPCLALHIAEVLAVLAKLVRVETSTSDLVVAKVAEDLDHASPPFNRCSTFASSVVCRSFMQTTTDLSR